MNLQPLKGKVIVQYDEPGEKTTASGIIVSENPEHNPLPSTGKVVAIGEGVDEVSVGDRVHFSEFSPRGFKTEQSGPGLLRIDKTQINAILDDEL